MQPGESKNITPTVKGLIRGDRECFSTIYDLFKNKIYFYALRITKSEHFAEEIVQEVFIKVWIHRDRINPELSFSSFVFKIAHNHSINVLKKHAYEIKASRSIEFKNSTPPTETEDQFVYQEYMTIVAEAVNSLPPRRKSIFNLSRNVGLGHDQIAEELGISKNTVKSQMVKASKFVKEYLAVRTGESWS